MGSSSTKHKKKGKKTRGKHNLPDHIYNILSKCMHSLPFPDGQLTEEMVQKAAVYTEIVELFEPQEIITKGQRSKGLYIVLKGEAEVLSSMGEVVATLATGSLFGELSTLFYIPCTATVRITAKASLLLLRAEKLRVTIRDLVVSMSLLDYYVSKRYFDTNEIIKEPVILSQQITKSILKEVPMFKTWEDVAIDTLIKQLQISEDPVLLVPPKSFVVSEGDPADEIIIIARGKVEVLHEKELITELDATRWPVCLGEEGLFTSNHSLVSVKTSSPCMAIIIKNEYIKQVAEEYKATVDYTERIDMWGVHPGVDEESPIRMNYGAQLVLPVLLKRLSDTPLLFEAPLDLVYELAMDCEIKERRDSKVIMGKHVLARRKSSRLVRNDSKKYDTEQKAVCASTHGVSLPAVRDDDNKDPFRIPPEGTMTVDEAHEAFEDSDKFIVVLSGSMVLGENNDWTCKNGEMLWIPRRLKHKTKLAAKGDTLTLQFSGATILEACSKYPDTTLYIPSTLK